MTTYGAAITQEEYVEYLTKYYPETDKYLLYSGGCKDQLMAFKEANPGYFYDDFYDSDKSQHYKDAFPPKPNPIEGKPELWREDNGEASSTAIAEVATKEVKVFGAAQYRQIMSESFFAVKEAPTLHEGLDNQRLSTIKHMAKEALHPDEVMATEDSQGKFTYLPGYEEGTLNQSPRPEPEEPESPVSEDCKRSNGTPCGGSSGSKPDLDPDSKPDPKLDPKPVSGPSGSLPYGDAAAQGTDVGDMTASHGASGPAAEPAHEAPKATEPDIFREPLGIHL